MPSWMTSWFTAQTVTAFLLGAIASVSALYYRHWFQRAAKRQTVARYLHHYLGKIWQAMSDASEQAKMQPQHYQAWHLSNCVKWLKELVDNEARISDLEEPELEMALRDKIKSAYATADHFQSTFKPTPQFPQSDPILSLGSTLGPMPFLYVQGDLHVLRRKLNRYRGPLLLQWWTWWPRTSANQKSRLLAVKK